MNRKYLLLLERTMREDMTNRNVTKFQDAYNIYLDEIGINEGIDSSHPRLKVDGQYGDRTTGAATWLRQHDKWLDEEEAFQKVRGDVAGDRLDFYRKSEFTKPSDTSSVKKY